MYHVVIFLNNIDILMIGVSGKIIYFVDVNRLYGNKNQTLQDQGKGLQGC